MKYHFAIVIIVVTTVASVQGSLDAKKADEISHKCGAELKIPESELFKYDRPTSPETQTPLGQCYVECITTKIGLYDKENGFKEQAIVDIAGSFHTRYSGAELLTRIGECVREAKEVQETENGCERAYTGALCIHENVFRNRKSP